jgi:hypothetical protein
VSSARECMHFAECGYCTGCFWFWFFLLDTYLFFFLSFFLYWGVWEEGGKEVLKCVGLVTGCVLGCSNYNLYLDKVYACVD